MGFGTKWTYDYGYIIFVKDKNDPRKIKNLEKPENRFLNMYKSI